MSANSSYVDLGEDDNSINEPPRFPILLVVSALALGGLLVWFLLRKTN